MRRRRGTGALPRVGTRARPRVGWLTALALAASLLGGIGPLAACGSDERPPVARQAPEEVLTPESIERAARRPAERPPAASRARAVRVEGVGAQPEASGDPAADAPSPGVQSDAEVRAELAAAQRELRAFKAHLDAGAVLATGPRARVLADGTAQAPAGAPDVVKRVIMAANEIARHPYKWGGGHGAWRDSGYDCSGSVSFALAGAGLLDRPLASGAFAGYGEPGPGRWVTIYTNPGHIFMVVAGLRFDTSGRGRAGTRWQAEPRSMAGFVVRHPPAV